MFPFLNFKHNTLILPQSQAKMTNLWHTLSTTIVLASLPQSFPTSVPEKAGAQIEITLIHGHLQSRHNSFHQHFSPHTLKIFTCKSEYTLILMQKLNIFTCMQTTNLCTFGSFLYTCLPVTDDHSRGMYVYCSWCMVTNKSSNAVYKYS